MILLRYIEETGTRAIVNGVFHEYDDSTPRENTMEISELPEVEEHPNKYPMLYVNPITQEVWYEYMDRPESEQEKVARLERQLTLLQSAMDDILLGGGM